MFNDYQTPFSRQSEKSEIIQGGTGNDSLLGGEGNDTLDGGEGLDTLDGGAGSDILDGKAGEAIIIGGSGIDLLRGGKGESHLYGGDKGGRNDADADIFSITNGSFVMQSDNKDYVTINGFRLPGGVQSFWGEDGYAYYAGYMPALYDNIFGGILMAALANITLPLTFAVRYGVMYNIANDNNAIDKKLTSYKISA